MIRRAARRCFAESGYHDTTVDKICDTLGISKGSFYWYFNGKEEVFLSILDNWAERVEADMARQYGSALAGPSPLISAAKTLERETRRGRYLMPIWLEFLSQVGRSAKIRDGLSNLHLRIRGFLNKLLEPTLPPNLMAEDREALSVVFLAGFMGLICQEMVDPQGANSQKAVTQFMKILEHYVNLAEETPTGPVAQNCS